MINETERHSKKCLGKENWNSKLKKKIVLEEKNRFTVTENQANLAKLLKFIENEIFLRHSDSERRR